jgi:hypothetical protein
MKNERWKMKNEKRMMNDEWWMKSEKWKAIPNQANAIKFNQSGSCVKAL